MCYFIFHEDKEGATRFLLNITKFLPCHMVSHPDDSIIHKQYSSTTWSMYLKV